MVPVSLADSRDGNFFPHTLKKTSFASIKITAVYPYVRYIVIVARPTTVDVGRNEQ